MSASDSNVQSHNLVGEIRPVKPVLRGWIHTISAPLTTVAALVLVILAPTVGTKVACAVFLVCSALLFGTSAVYHRGTWGVNMEAVLRRMDHANIFLLIAGTYTPIAVAALPPSSATTLLGIVWGGAVVGILMRVFWLGAPRWVYTPIYILLGWVALWFMGDLVASVGWAVVWLLISGGLVYTLGAVFYGFRWPGRGARVFGFHEAFHTCTVIGWMLMCVAAYLAVLG